MDKNERLLNNNDDMDALTRAIAIEIARGSIYNPVLDAILMAQDRKSLRAVAAWLGDLFGPSLQEEFETAFKLAETR